MAQSLDFAPLFVYHRMCIVPYSFTPTKMQLPPPTITIVGSDVTVKVTERIPWSIPYGYTEITIERSYTLPKGEALDDTLRQHIGEDVSKVALTLIEEHEKKVSVAKYPAPSPVMPPSHA